MTWKMKMKSFITLFIVGIIGVVFCELNPEQISIITCIQGTMAEVIPEEYALLKKLTPENFLKASEVMPSINEKCKGQEVLIHDLMQKGGELVEKDKAYKRYKVYLKDETSSGFLRLMFGLLIDTKNTNVVSKLFERQFASAILAEKLIPGNDRDYYRRRYYANFFAYITGFEGIPIVTTQLSGCDPRTELLQDYCKKFSKGTLETDTDPLQIWEWLNGQIHKFRLFDPKNVYDSYVDKGRKTLSTKHHTEETFFISGVCNTSDWVNFNSLKDEVEKYDRIECILMNTDEFFNNVSELLNFEKWIHFQSTCVEKETFSIEQITDVGIEFLKEFDKHFLRLFLDTRNKIKKLDKNSEYEIEEKIKDEEKKIEKKRTEFMALHKKYKISLKWTCMSKDKEDVPFHSWLETFSILYKYSKTIMNYLNEFKEDTDDYFKSVEDNEKNMHAKILEIRSKYKNYKYAKNTELNENLEKGKITEFRKILNNVKHDKLDKLIGEIKTELDKLEKTKNADLGKLIEKTKNEIDKCKPAKNDELDELIQETIKELDGIQNAQRNAELYKLLKETDGDLAKLENDEHNEIQKVIEIARNDENAKIDKLYRNISEKIKKNVEEKDSK